MSARIDYEAGGEVAYTGADAWGVPMMGDMYDMGHMGTMVPPVAQQAGAPWWQALIQYGVTRAIDNRLGPTNIAGNQNPGNFAGQNGATYSQNPQGNGGGINRPGQPQQQAGGMGSNTLLLLAAAAVAVFALAG